MSEQMIELEEVTMVDASDESLECVVGRGGMFITFPNVYPC